jgi:hypothetical protein
MIFGYKMWISLKIFDGYKWIYPLISIDIHRYPTYPYISTWGKIPDVSRGDQAVTAHTTCAHTPLSNQGRRARSMVSDAVGRYRSTTVGLSLALKCLIVRINAQMQHNTVI